MDLKEAGWEDMHWVHLTPDTNLRNIPYTDISSYVSVICFSVFLPLLLMFQINLKQIYTKTYEIF
jgi:hypothetical protein